MSAKRNTPTPLYACGSRPSSSKLWQTREATSLRLTRSGVGLSPSEENVVLAGVDYRPSCKSELLDGRETRTTNPRPTVNRCRRRCGQIDGERPYAQTAQIGQNPNCGFLQRRDYTKLRQHGETRRELIVIFYLGADHGSD
jgi:hypothetical protein